MHCADRDMECFVSENSSKIQEMKDWAANEARREFPTPTPKTEVLARIKAMRTKVEIKLDSDWFCSVDHPKKQNFKNYVMDQIAFELLMCFDESVKNMIYRCAAGK